MRLRRKKLDITPSEDGSVWPLFGIAGMALLLTPGATAGGLADALSSANVPAVLLTCGLLSAVVERRK